MKEIDVVKNRIKNKQSSDSKNNAVNNYIFKFIVKFIIIVIIFVISTILINKSPKIKNNIYKKVYNSSFSFAKVKKVYNEHIGNVLPFQDILKTKQVFSEKLQYQSISKYNKGAKLIVSDNYLIPAIKGGIVIFSGKKNNLETIIVQQSDGIDVSYSNLSNKNVKLYDYIDDNQIIGEVKDNTLYLTFQKDGVEIDYKKIIK